MIKQMKYIICYQRDLCAIMMKQVQQEKDIEDEIGTPYCVTIDFDTMEDNKVTVRDRDTMEQERISIDELEEYISKKIEF